MTLYLVIHDTVQPIALVRVHGASVPRFPVQRCPPGAGSRRAAAGSRISVPQLGVAPSADPYGLSIVHVSKVGYQWPAQLIFPAMRPPRRAGHAAATSLRWLR